MTLFFDNNMSMSKNEVIFKCGIYALSDYVLTDLARVDDDKIYFICRYAAITLIRPVQSTVSSSINAMRYLLATSEIRESNDRRTVHVTAFASIDVSTITPVPPPSSQTTARVVIVISR